MECATFEKIRATGRLLEMPQLGRQLRVLELDEARECTAEDVIALIAKDTRLVENVLRYVRPAHTGQGGQMSSLSDAIGVVGLHGLKITALSLAVIAHEFDLDCHALDQSRFKLHSLGCGIAAQSLCSDLRWASPAEAFGTGVLSQIGRLALAHAFPGDYAEVLSQCHGSSAQLEMLEEARFGVSYTVISECVLREWGLPEPLCHAIGQLGRSRDPWSAAPLPRLLRISEVASNVICPVTESIHRDISDLVEIAWELGEISEKKCLSLTSTLFSELADAIQQLGLGGVSLRDVRDHDLQSRLPSVAASRTNGASLAQRQADLIKAAHTDGLTGIANRAAFDERLIQELRRVGRYGMHAIVLLVDVDQMRLINNAIGYLAGDYVLRTVGRTLAELIREVDFCARFGGDEFAILATMNSVDDVVGLAERLCRAIEALPVLGLNRDLNAKVSIGVAYASDVYDMESASEAILRAASDQLFLAKQRGGNQYCMQGRSTPTAASPTDQQEAGTDAEQPDHAQGTGQDDTPPDGQHADCPTPEYVEQY